MNGYDAKAPRVLVMMSTYNGERFLEEQIESILAQEGVEVSLQICDDCSSDSTVIICRRYAESHGNVSFSQNRANKGFCMNFMDMVYSAPVGKFDYFAFSDQDDYWLPDKLAHAVGHLEEAGGPCALYYSDVRNYPEDLSGEGSGDYYVYEGYEHNLKALFVNNWASGCTMVFDRGLCGLLQGFTPSSFPVPYHDIWVHMVALSCGTVAGELGESFLKRRIHGNNLEGESTLGAIDGNRVKSFLSSLAKKRSHNQSKMVELLLEGFSEQMHPESRKVAEQFVSMRYSFPARVRNFFDPQYCRPNRVEHAILKVRILFNFV